ncbi:MAG: ABC transporter ATP-binding protein [Nitrospinae bacterium]|nr:ABC transporter ATP-binding protein [Nitrospinota bacterium]
MNAPFVVEALGLTRRFVLDDRTLTVLDRVDLAVPQGERLAIVGASGAGKSTLLHLLGGLDRPTEGTVRFGDTDIFSLPDAARSRWRAQRIGFVFQNHLLLPEFSAVENVALAAMIRETPRREALRLAEERLLEVGLKERLHHRPGKLSGGEQQRVALARALVNGPALVLADEPTGNLDTRTGEEVFELITRLNEERRLTFVIVTHNLDLARRMDRTIGMKDGRIG